MNFPKKFPVLTIGPYLLREAIKKDAPHYFNALTDYDTYKHTSYNVKTLKEVEEWIADYKSQFKDEKRISWVIEDTRVGHMIGEVSLFEVQVSHSKGEVGFFLAKSYANQGVMTQILKKLIPHLFRTFKMKRLQAVSLPDNKGCRSVLEKNGFQQEGLLRKYKRFRNRYGDVILYAKIA